MSAFKKYRRKHIAELRPYVGGEDLANVSISAVDCKRGSPKPGDMIARNPKDHADQWLVAETYFADNFEPLEAIEPFPDHECVRCGAEDSETANGCDLCLECGSLLDVAREAVAAVNEAEVPNMREQLARWLAVLEKWSDDSSKKLEAT